VVVLGTVVDEEQEARRGQAVGEAIEQGLGLAVDPVQVLEDHHQRLDLALAQQQALDRVERLLAPLGRIEGVPGRLVHRHVEERQEGGHGGRERRGERQDLPRDLLPDLPRVVAALDLEVAAEQLDHGQVGGGLAVGDRGGLHDEPAVHAVGVGELPEEARLAHARLPDHGDHLAVAQARPVEGAAELLQLRGAADEAREPPSRRGLQTGAGGAGSHQLEHLDRLAEALDRHRAERDDLDEALGQVQRPGGEPDAAGGGELLHAGRQVRGLAHGGVVHAEIAADRAHHDVAGVEADADLDFHALGAAKLIRVAPDGVLHPERGIARAHGVIFMGERGAEERHDAVAHHLIHGALVAVDGVHHPLEHGVENLARLLGITVGEQLHGALEVGEEDGDLLALALEGGLRSQDLLGEVPGGIALRNAEVRRGRLGCGTTLGQPVTALLAELHAQLIRGPATGARLLQAGTTFLAEHSITRVLVPAPRTGHRTLATPIVSGLTPIGKCGGAAKATGPLQYCSLSLPGRGLG